MRKTGFGLLLLLLLISISGCAGGGISAQRSAAGDELESSDLPEGNVLGKFEALRNEGIYMYSQGESAQGRFIEVYRADQRAIKKIREAVGDDVIIRECREILFVRGQISEISETETGFLSIFVEGKEEPDTAAGRAYASIGDETRVLKPAETGYVSLPYDSLEVGQTVEVWVAGVILDSLPPHAGAVTVIITD